MLRGYKSFYKNYWGVDFKNLQSDINLNIPSNGWEDLIDDLNQYNSIEVHLSGGIDSMFLCLMLQKYNIPFHALTFEYDNGYNDYEVDSAKKFCSKYNIKHYIKPFHLTHFLESGRFEEYADMVQCSSPQYSTFLKMYTMTNADMIVVDGSPPVVLLDDNDLNHVEAEIKWVDIKDHSIEKKHYGIQTIGEHTYPIICYGTDASIGSQLRFVEKIKQPCIMNLCYYSPNILLDGCRKVIEYLKSYKLRNPDDIRWSYFFEKHQLYNTAYDLNIEAKEPKTGFEKIKEHYKTVYNKNFNEIFRQPLLEKYPNTMYETSIGGVINDL